MNYAVLLSLLDITECSLRRLKAAQTSSTLTLLRDLQTVTVSEFVGKVSTDIVEMVKGYYLKSGKTETELQTIIRLVGDRSMAQFMASAALDPPVIWPNCTGEGRFFPIQCHEAGCTCVNVLTGEPWGPLATNTAISCAGKLEEHFHPSV